MFETEAAEMYLDKIANGWEHPDASASVGVVYGLEYEEYESEVERMQDNFL